MDRRTFNHAAEVRAFLKQQGFNKISVRYKDNPFGSAGKFFVTIIDIPKSVTLIHSSGGNQPATTASFAPVDDTTQGVLTRIAKLRELLKDTNAAVNH